MNDKQGVLEQTTPIGAASTGGAASRRPRIPSAGQLLIELRAFIALIVVIVLFSALTPSFLTTTNVVGMTQHVAINAIIAIGMLFVILTGGIDLSVGSIVAASGIVAGLLIQKGLPVPGTDLVGYPPVWGVVLLALAAGALIGFINGLVITRLKVAAFIATLGMLYIARGVTLLVSDGKSFASLQGSPERGNTGLSWIGSGHLLGIPAEIVIMLVVIVIAAFVTTKTRFGRQVYAIGGNPKAAELAGVRVKRNVTFVYVIAGMCGAIGGVLVTADLQSATPAAGQGYELAAIAAVVLGGASLFGGRGTVRGTVLGAFVIGFLSDGLVLVGVPEFWQQIIKGGVIVAAVALDQVQVGHLKPLRRPKTYQANNIPAPSIERNNTQ